MMIMMASNISWAIKIGVAVHYLIYINIRIIYIFRVRKTDFYQLGYAELEFKPKSPDSSS